MKPAQLRKRVEKVIAGNEKDTGLAKFLTAVSKIYGPVMDCRAKLYNQGALRKKSIPCKVISIGNLTLGGSGKTPMAIYAAKLLKQKGLKAAVVSRGYGGNIESSNAIGIVSDGKQMFLGPDQAGDESFLMATKLGGIPVLVGKNRYAAGMLACKKFDPDIVILDDAYQHLAIHRDLNILLLDAGKPFGNLHIFPRGNLREPVKQVQRADAIILTRSLKQDCAAPKFPEEIHKLVRDLPIFRACHCPEGFTRLAKNGQWQTYSSTKLASKKCLAFSGIVRNTDFKKMLSKLELRISAFLTFPDHHKYTRYDIAQILKTAEKSGAEILVTTEKDLVKLSGSDFSPYKIYALCIKVLIWNNRKHFEDFILSR